jgi:hypothetical protein
MTTKGKNKQLNFTFRVTKNGQTIQTYHSMSKRRFYNRTGTINWQDGGVCVYLRVNYGKHLSNLGKVESFWNDGFYETKEDFDLSLSAFTEN